MTRQEMLLAVFSELTKKSGVREWQDSEQLNAIVAASIAVVDGLLQTPPQEPSNMALPDFVRIEPGTAKVIKSSGGDAAITLASLANGNGTSAGGRQSATIDLGANWARLWRIGTEFELAATPTAGNAINLFASWQNATGAGTGNTSGSDAAYTGYSNNIDAATKQMEFIGAHICTSQATATIQKANVGVIMPKGRYLNLVVDNRSGAAFHSSDANCLIRLTPLEDKILDSI